MPTLPSRDLVALTKSEIQNDGVPKILTVWVVSVYFRIRCNVFRDLSCKHVENEVAPLGGPIVCRLPFFSRLLQVVKTSTTPPTRCERSLEAHE